MIVQKENVVIEPLMESGSVVGISNNGAPIYCLKPGSISIPGLTPVFHGLPRNAHKIKRITESSEYFISRKVCDMLAAGQPERDLKGRTEEDKQYRKAYFRRKSMAIAKTNKLLRDSMAVADMDAVKLARRFDGANGAIYKYAAESIRFKQLIAAFPVLGYRICNCLSMGDVRFDQTQEGFDDESREIIALVESGAKLKVIADYFKIPMSLRKVKPQAAKKFFHVFFSRTQEKVTDDIIHAYLPKTAMEQYRLSFGLKLFYDHYDNRLYEIESLREGIHWMFKTFNAKERLSISCGKLHGEIFDYIKARELYGARKFNSNMSYESAKEESENWHQRVINNRAYGADINATFAEPWLPPYQDESIKIEPITTVKDLIAEGIKMKHCVSQYATYVKDGTSYIYSVIAGDYKIATLELRKRNKYNVIPEITVAQLRGPCNQEVDEPIRNLVYSWVAKETGKLGFISA